VEERPQKPNLSGKKNQADDSWQTMIEKFGRAEFNLIYNIMDKVRANRFSIEN
jgi:hypothetical protein